MKFIGRVSLVILALIFLAGIGYWTWGRRVIYPQESRRSEYIGQGKSIEAIFAHLVVSPKAEGEPFIANIGDGANYPASEYDVASVPAQEGVNFVVGRVNGWEEIPGQVTLLDVGLRPRREPIAGLLIYHPTRDFR